MNNLTDRRTFLSQTTSENEFEGTTNIMDRSSFTHPDNRKMRDDFFERHSKIEDTNKSTFGVRLLDDDERVRYFDLT